MRFVASEPVRIHLADGPNGEKNWIDIKKRLTKGEDAAYRSAAARYVFDDAEPELDEKGKPKPRKAKLELDMALLPLTKVHAYVIAWSAGVPVDLDAIKALDPDDFDEIEKAINEHIAKVDAEKKATNGSGKPISPSA